MATTPEHYLAVLKASYDYEPQPDATDEIAIKEDQLLFLLEKTDDDWWKVKVKLESQDEEGPAGLVPSAYVEPAQPISVVKALYEYEANADGELSLQEDEVLHVYAKDDDWLLVHSQKEGGKIGYIPGNYVEETSDEGEASEAPAAAPSVSGIDFSKLVIPEDPPKPAYTDPTELVSRSKAKAHGGPVETWSISEVDKKGKKKKGTLGVGNGSMFFASESDKTPVQKWQASDIQSTRVEKGKHVHVEVTGPNAAELHFHAGSKEVAEAIIAKLQEARTDAKVAEEEESPAPLSVTPPERPRSSAAKSVHFDNSEPEIIPDREEEEAEAEGTEEEVHEEEEDNLGAGERAVVLYDFVADGDDEMTVHEGETLLVLERDTDEWWKCKNARGEEGVVPANYLELVPGSGGPQPSVAVEDGRAAREAEEAAARVEAERRAKEESERKEKERRKAEAEQRAKAAAAQAEADRKKREQERERQKEKEKERESQVAAAERKKQKEKRDSTAESSSARNSKASGESSRASQDRRRPAPEDTRVWHDKSGQFRVEAAFLGYTNGKLRLHKANGVIIEVPSEKMSSEDMAYIEKLTVKQRKASSPRRTSDDETLASRRESLKVKPRPTSQAPKKGPTIDWFEFFLNAGCDIDDCTRYGQSFERDKIDEALLPDITEDTMRRLGLREGDIIRVKKHIEQTKGKSTSGSDAKAEQLRRDEELARQLQAEESGGTPRGQPPSLFSGPNGELKNNVRRGRPQPSKSLPPATVDLNSISSASDQIQRSGTPLVISPVRTGGTPTPAPAKSASPAPAAIANGFDDNDNWADAWKNRPSSTKPTPSPAPARAASVPPAPPAPPVQAAAPAVATPPPAPTPPAPPASAPPAQAKNLANTTESDVFDQLSRLAAIRTQSPAIVNRPVASPPTVVSPPPSGYHSGLGVGSSPAPIAQHLQAQQTGIFPPPAINGPRGPLAPVPANQSLLQPLVPTPTGYGAGFVPTRQGTSPFQSSPSPSFLNTQPTGFVGNQQQQLGPQPTGFQPQQPLGPQPTGFQPSPSGFQPSLSGFQTQPTGFQSSLTGLQPQPTGFQPQTSGFQPQPTGFQPQAPLMSQPTGFGNGVGGQFNGLPGNGSFTPIQSNPTGFNPSFGQINASSPPPLPQQQSAVNTNPANVFAQMKSGTFGADNNNAPKNANQYDALRPQATGWVGGYQNTQGFGGYGYQ